MLVPIIVASAAALYSAPVMATDDWYRAVFYFPESSESALKPGELTQADVEITVDPHGNFVSCRSKGTFGNPALGPYSCDRAKGRAEFNPARAPNGTRMYGVYRAYFSMVAGDKPPPPAPHKGTFQITVPPASTNLDSFVIQFAVDAAGSVLPGSCSLVPTTTDIGIEINRQHVEPTLASQACAALPEKFEPAKDRSGEATPSVQNAWVDVLKSSPH